MPPATTVSRVGCGRGDRRRRSSRSSATFSTRARQRDAPSVTAAGRAWTGPIGEPCDGIASFFQRRGSDRRLRRHTWPLVSARSAPTRRRSWSCSEPLWPCAPHGSGTRAWIWRRSAAPQIPTQTRLSARRSPLARCSGMGRRLRASALVGDDRPLRLEETTLYLDRYWSDECQVAPDLLLAAETPADIVDIRVLNDGYRDFSGGKRIPCSALQRSSVLRRFRWLPEDRGPARRRRSRGFSQSLDEQALASEVGSLSSLSVRRPVRPLPGWSRPSAKRRIDSTRSK